MRTTACNTTPVPLRFTGEVEAGRWAIQHENIHKIMDNIIGNHIVINIQKQTRNRILWKAN